uniref:Uncharacterized protein n=1 Tax=Lotharella globosa TaxID=91324 RepID=A0A7S4DXS3_9EUKA
MQETVRSHDVYWMNHLKPSQIDDAGSGLEARKELAYIDIQCFNEWQSNKLTKLLPLESRLFEASGPILKLFFTECPTAKQVELEQLMHWAYKLVLPPYRRTKKISTLKQNLSGEFRGTSTWNCFIPC